MGGRGGGRLGCPELGLGLLWTVATAEEVCGEQLVPARADVPNGGS